MPNPFRIARLAVGLWLTITVVVTVWIEQRHGIEAALVFGLGAMLVACLGWAIHAEWRAQRHAKARDDMARRLQDAQKLAALGQLSGGVAHDFNNLLAVIIGNIELMLESLGDNAGLRQPAELILHAGERGRILTQRLLGFARQRRFQARQVDVNALLMTCCRLLNSSLGGRVVLDMQLADALAPADVDPDQLEATIVNLIINARDAMPAGGRITIASANATIRDEGMSHVPQLKPGQYVRITIDDTGEGIRDDLKRWIFEPFFTTKEHGEGTGLGLSMAQSFLRESGGHIVLFSEPSEGTRVHLYLPTAPAARSRDASRQPLGQDARQDRLDRCVGG